MMYPYQNYPKPVSLAWMFSNEFWATLEEQVGHAVDFNIDGNRAVQFNDVDHTRYIVNISGLPSFELEHWDELFRKVDNVLDLLYPSHEYRSFIEEDLMHIIAAKKDL